MVFIQNIRDLLSGVKFNRSGGVRIVDNLWKIKEHEKLLPLSLNFDDYTSIFGVYFH